MHACNELTMNFEVFILPVLYGQHIQRGTVGKHQSTWFLLDKRKSRGIVNYNSNFNSSPMIRSHSSFGAEIFFFAHDTGHNFIWTKFKFGTVC